MFELFQHSSSSIHQFNKAALFKCILPYHQNIIFIKMITIIKLKGTNLWEFLEPTLHSGVPPKRSVLVDRMVMDRNLLIFVLNMVKEAVSTRTSYKTLHGFYTAILLEAISTHGVSENMLRDIWPFVISGLSSTDENYQTGSIMILSCACWKAAVSLQLVRSAIDTMMAHTVPHLHSTALRAIIMIVQNAVLSSTGTSSTTLANSNPTGSSTGGSSGYKSVCDQIISDDSISVLVSWSDVPQILSGFAQSQHYDMGNFLNYLLNTLASDLHKDSNRANFLFKLFETLNVGEQIPNLMVTLLSSYKATASPTTTTNNKSKTPDSKKKKKSKQVESDEEESDEEVEESDEIKTERLARLLAHIDLKYPQQLDEGVELMLKEQPKNTDWSQLFQNGRHHPLVNPSTSNGASTTLSLCLRNSLPQSKIFAVTTLLQLRQTEMTENTGKSTTTSLSKLLETTLLEHLNSGNEQLVMNALKIPKLGSYVQPDTLFSTLESLIGAHQAVSQKAFATVTKLFLNPTDASTGSSTSGSSSTPASKKSKRASLNSAAAIGAQPDVYPLENASVKLMPLVLSNLFSVDEKMRELAAQAALQFHQHFKGNSPVVPCQHVFSNYSSSIASSADFFPEAVLALATSAVTYNDYVGKSSSWQSIMNNPRTKIIALNVLNCALSQVAHKQLQPTNGRSIEDECLAIVKVLLPYILDDSQTMLLAVDVNAENFSELFHLSQQEQTIKSSIVGLPPWTPTTYQGLFQSTPYYKREIFFRYLVWVIYNVIESFSLLVGNSDRMVSYSQSIFKILASAQNPSVFSLHLKTLLTHLGSDVQIAHFLQDMWLTPPSKSTVSSTTLLLDSPADTEHFPVGLHGSSTSAIVTVRSLNILNTLLNARLASLQNSAGNSTTNSADNLNSAEFAQNLIPSLLVALVHHEPAVRLASLNCLHFSSQILGLTANVSTSTPSKSKKNAPNKQNILAVLDQFLRLLVDRRREIGLSEQFLSTFLETTLSATGETLEASSASLILNHLVSQAITLPTTYAKSTLLYAMLSTPNEPKLKLTQNLMKKLMELTNESFESSTRPDASEGDAQATKEKPLKVSSKSSTNFQNDVDVFKLMATLIQQWTVDACDALNSHTELFDTLVASLHNPFEVSLTMESQSAPILVGQAEKSVLNILNPNSEVFNFSVQLSTLQVINAEFFAALNASRQQVLFEQLCELILSPKHAVKEKVQSVIRQVIIAPSIIAHELQQCVEKTNPPSVEPSPASHKRAKRSAAMQTPADSNISVLQEVDKKWIARVTVLLEMLQYKRDALQLGSHYVEPLFALMRNTIETENALAKDASAEYIEQLIFTTLVTITQAISLGLNKGEKKRPVSNDMEVDGEAQEEKMEESIEAENIVDPMAFAIHLDKSEFSKLESKYDVDSIIQIIRVRSNPTLQNSALLLLSQIATIFPSKVMANVMSIFSFMGASTERSDDNYTFNVIEKTVDRVIPALLNHAPGVEARVSASTLLSIFIDRIDSIPQHRRLMLFTHILTKVLRRGYLSLVLALLLHKQTNQNLNSKNQNLDFALAPVHRKDSKMELQVFKDQSKMMDDISKDGDHELLKKTRSKAWLENSEQMSMTSFALTLFHKLSPYECFSAIFYTLYWLNGFENKLHNSPLVTGRTKDYSAQEKANMHFIVIEFALSYISSRPLIAQLMESDSHEQQRMQNVYLALFQTLLMFAKLVSNENFVRSVKDEILANVYKLIDKVNELMSIYTFFDVMSSLLKQPDATIKHRALVLFNERIKALARAERAGFDFGEQTTATFIQFTLNMFKSIALQDQQEMEETVEASERTESSLNLALNKQTAALSVEIVARLFGTYEQHHSSLLQLTDLVLASLMPFASDLEVTKFVGHSEHQIKVQASMIVTLATLCASLREKMLPLINKIFPILLSTLKLTIGADREKDPRGLLQQSCLTAIQVVISVMHRFLSQYWPETFQLLLQPTGVFYGTPQWTQVEAIMQQIGETVPARLLLEPLSNVFEYIMSYDYMNNEDNNQEIGNKRAQEIDNMRVPVVKLLVKTTGVVASTLDRPTLHSHHKLLFKVFLGFFDYATLAHQHALAYTSDAHQPSQPPFMSIADVEECIIASFMKLTLKLNENLFKPLFLVILDWAKISVNISKTEMPSLYTPRSMFFYRLVLTLTEELKAIFVPYFAYILDHAVKVVLQQAKEVKKSDPILKTSITAFTGMPSSVTGGALIHHQLCLVLDGLQKLFLYDNDSFVDKSKFDRLMPVLVDQLDGSHIENYKARVTGSIVPCLAQLAVSIANDTLWKPMNHNVLTKARHMDAQVRFSTLLVIGEFYHRLGESFLTLLPESVQTFSELLEDSSPEVERQCLTLIQQIEQVLGEEGGVMSLLSK